MGLWRVGHDWVTSLSLFTFMHWIRKWQPIPVFLPGESQGEGSLVGCCLWGRTGWTRLMWLSSSSSRSQDLVQAGLTILYLSRWRVSRMDRHILIFYIWIFLEIAKQQEDPLGICSALKKMKSAHATMWKQKETICCNGWMDIHGHYFYLVFLKPWK